MTQLRSLLARHTLSIGFAVALVPLVVMVAMQYVWLSRLERASALAREATHRGYLETVVAEVERYYRTSAERLLDIPAALLRHGELDVVASHWQRQSLVGFRRLFVVDFTRVASGNYYIYEPQQRTLVSTVASDESLAMILATLPWQTRTPGPAARQQSGLHVDERDPDHRLILSPVLAADGSVAAVVGAILDADYLRDVLLGQIARRLLTTTFPPDERTNLSLIARADRAVVVLGTPGVAGAAVTASVRLPFVFRDWSLDLASTGASAAERAGASFVFDMAIGALLALTLLGGLSLALRAARRAMRLSQMKADFVANVSHELRTPIASIRVLAELMRLGKVPDHAKVVAYGETIERESRRLATLIDGVLEYARIESHERQYHFEQVDVAALLQSLVQEHRPRLEQSGFRLQLDRPPGPGPTVALDAEATRQAVGNLIDNAAKYSTPPSDITVALAWDETAVAISVRDHGVGIPRSEQRRVFERFHRVGTGLVHDVKGAGLGLAIVAEVAKAHHGSIRVTSELGQGSTFVLKLPAKGGNHAQDPHRRGR